MEEEVRKGNTREFFKRAKEITGKFTHRIGTLKSETGKTLTEKNEIKERWKEYIILYMCTIQEESRYQKTICSQGIQ